MKNIIFGLLLLTNLTVFGQTDNNLVLSVGVPLVNNDLSRPQMQQLGNKTKQIISQNGISALAGQQFMVYPTYTILSDEKLALAKTIYSVEAEIVFTVAEVSNGLVFDTFTSTVKGSGTSRKKAIDGSIRKIDTRSTDYRNFIKEAKEKLLAYYNQNCQKLIDEAVQLAEQQQFEVALAKINAIPKEASCKTNADATALRILEHYQYRQCKNWLQQAKVATAKRAYQEALKKLALIDPLSHCKEEAAALIEQLGSLITAEHQEYWRRLDERYHNELQMESYRLEIYHDIMLAQAQNPAASTQISQQFLWIN